MPSPYTTFLKLLEQAKGIIFKPEKLGLEDYYSTSYSSTEKNYRLFQQAEDANPDFPRVDYATEVLVHVTTDCKIRWNDSRNVQITLLASLSPYNFEGKFWRIFFVRSTVDGTIYIYSER